MKNFEAMERDFPAQTLLVPYERIVQKTDHELSEILKFLDAEARPAIAARYSYEVPERYGDLHANIDKKPMGEKIDQWREGLSDLELQAYGGVAGDYMKKYGYD